METTVAIPNPEVPSDFLLHYKYLAAVRRVARGMAHGYNNIFTGLGGQFTMFRQEMGHVGEHPAKRTDLIGDLLRRGIEQTAILSGIARRAEAGAHSHFPMSPATKAVELLNCISRVHRFELVSGVRTERLVCNIQDVILLLFYIGENCVDATPDGGTVLLEISLADEETGDNQQPGLAFCFRDRGPGIPDPILKKIGTPFVSGTGDAPYRGLGLYAAQTLAGRNQGRIAFAGSAAGETLVSAIFPLAASEKKIEPRQRDTAAAPPKKEPLTKQCFLVVEDDEAMRTLLLNRLQRRGHMVFCVTTCREALDEYAQLYDIITTILMDVGLRDTSGYECSRKLLAVNPQARIIFMSGLEAMTFQGGQENTAFLQKPFTMDQLEKAVRDVHI
jgi:CheY-like chemotaxis protein